MLLWRTALFFVLVALAAALDLVDNSGCVSEGMECDSTEECCSGGMSTLCSSGKCRCWGGMQWRASIRRCVPIYSFGRFDPGGDDYDLHPHEEYVPPPVVPTWKPEPRTTQTSSEGVDDRQVVVVVPSAQSPPKVSAEKAEIGGGGTSGGGGVNNESTALVASCVLGFLCWLFVT